MNRVRSANKFLQANAWRAKAYLTNTKFKDKGQLFGIMAFVNGLSGLPTVLFADGTTIEYTTLTVENSRIVLDECMLYYTIGKAKINQVVIMGGMYQRGDEDYPQNRLKYAQDSQGFKSIEEYVMGYHLNKANLKRLDELLIGDSESTLFEIDTQLFKRD